MVSRLPVDKSVTKRKFVCQGKSDSGYSEATPNFSSLRAGGVDDKSGIIRFDFIPDKFFRDGAEHIDKEKDSMSQAVYLIFIRVLNPVFPIKMTDRSAIYLKLWCIFLS